MRFRFRPSQHLQDYGEIAADVARYREFARQVQDVLLALQQDVHAERGRWKEQEEKARVRDGRNGLRSARPLDISQRLSLPCSP